MSVGVVWGWRETSILFRSKREVRAVWNLGGGLYPGASPPHPPVSRYLKNCEEGAWALRFTERAGYGSPRLYLVFWTLRQEALKFEASLEDSEFQVSLDYRVKPVTKKHLSSSSTPIPNNNKQTQSKERRQRLFSRPEGAR